MKPLYDFKEITNPFFPSKEFKLKKEVDKIFSVPEDNCLGTNSLWNAITLLRFNKDKIKYDILKKNFIPYVTGGSLFFMPVFSSDTIGYAQTRRFITFNIKNKKRQRHSVCNRLEETISKVRVVSWEKKYFLFSISSAKPEKILRVIDLSGDNKKTISEKSYHGFSSQFKDTIFFHSEKDIYATDLFFKPKSHSLVDFIKKNSDIFTEIIDVIIHKTHSFAMIVDYDKKDRSFRSWLIKWNEKKAYQLLLLFEKAIPANPVFSPDNQWFIFKNNAKNPKTYYTMRIDPSFPNYLSAPIPLGEAPDYPEDATAWTTNPLSFVVSKGDRLVRYELEKFKNYNFKDLAK